MGILLEHTLSVRPCPPINGGDTCRLRRPGIIIRTLLALIVSCSAVQSSDTLDADALAGLVGYTIVAASTVAGEFEGADFDKLVKLDNGMVFEFQEYSYTYSYRPTAVVLARTYSLEEMRQWKLKAVPTRPMTRYKLVVEDEIYDVVRVR